MSDVRVTGLSELRARLASLRTGAVEAAPAAVSAAAEPIKTAWRGGVPVKTGHYRDAIDVRELEHDGSSARAIVSAEDVPYAGEVEFGTPQRPANGAARAAMDEHSDTAIDAAAEKFRRRLR